MKEPNNEGFGVVDAISKSVGVDLLQLVHNKPNYQNGITQLIQYEHIVTEFGIW